jgi:hypothetical protein
VSSYQKVNPYSKIVEQNKFRASKYAGSSRDGTEPSYQNPSSMDASLIENTNRTGEFNDPLDQGHIIEKDNS